MIVVDTNVIASLYLESEFSELAEKALRKDPLWIAPLLWLSEMRNLIAALARARRIEMSSGIAAIDAAETLMADRAYAVPSTEVMQLAVNSGQSAYVCELVALALGVGTKLVTLDKRLALRFPEVAVTLERFARSVH